DSRNPERWNLAHVDAMKCRRCNPDNRHWILVQQHLSADDIRSASELVLPELVGEHNHGAGTGCVVIIGGQEPAERGVHSEYRKIVTGYEFCGSQLGFSTRRGADRRGGTA